MAVLLLTKHAAETYLLGVDFGTVPVTALASGAVSATDSAGTSATAAIWDGAATVDGTIVQARLKAGAAPGRYRLTFRGTTAGGDVYEEDVDLGVLP